MEPTRKDQVYEAVLENILKELPRNKRKMLLWNKHELKRVEETSKAMEAAERGLDDHNEALQELGPFLNTRLNAARLAYSNSTGAPEDSGNLRIALGTALEAIEEMRKHEARCYKYIEEMKGRVKLANHKLRIQTIQIAEHGKMVEIHFAMLDTALNFLNGSLLPLGNNVRQLVNRRLQTYVERIVMIVQIIFFFVLACIIMALYSIFRILLAW